MLFCSTAAFAVVGEDGCKGTALALAGASFNVVFAD